MSVQSRAHQAVSKAVREGALVRPSLCSRCGVEPLTGIEAHHEDYAKPLDVEWLCKLCHRGLHVRERAERRPLRGDAVVTFEVSPDLRNGYVSAGLAGDPEFTLPRALRAHMRRFVAEYEVSEAGRAA